MRPGNRYRFAVVALGGLAASYSGERIINRMLRPDAEEVTWISDAVLWFGFVLVTWLWIRLNEARVALSDLARQQVAADAQLTIAARVQRSLLPAVPRPVRGIEWAAAIEPAQKVGGDFYDFLPLADGRMYVVVADVSGKGVPAALFLANVRAILHALAEEGPRPRQLVSRLSSALIADSASGLYVTCIVAMVDPHMRSMVYVNAGHPSGVLWSRRRVRGLTVGGPPAGLLADARFEEEEVAFGEGDLVTFVSDGVTEALDAGGDGVVAALAAQIERADSFTPNVVCAHLLAVAAHGSGPRGVDEWTDDRTAVVFGVVSDAALKGTIRSSRRYGDLPERAPEFHPV